MGVMQRADDQFVIHETHAAVSGIHCVRSLRNDFLPMLVLRLRGINGDDAPARSSKAGLKIKLSRVCAGKKIPGRKTFYDRRDRSVARAEVERINIFQPLVAHFAFAGEDYQPASI